MKKIIDGYTNEDVSVVLKKAYENALKDRELALDMFEFLKEKIKNDAPEAPFIVQHANSFLENATKSNDLLIKIVGAQQRLQTNTIMKLSKDNAISSEDYNRLLETMDDKDKADKVVIHKTKEEIIKINVEDIKKDV